MNDLLIFIPFLATTILSNIILHCESERLEKWCIFITLNSLNLIQLMILCNMLK